MGNAVGGGLVAIAKPASRREFTLFCSEPTSAVIESPGVSGPDVTQIGDSDSIDLPSYDVWKFAFKARGANVAEPRHQRRLSSGPKPCN